MRCLVVQTAFLGDVVLTVPLLALLGSSERVSWLGVVASPPGDEFLEGQGIADRVFRYDKRGGDAGPSGLARAVRELREASADVAVIPHRSFRSALMPALARIPRRLGFDVSGGRLLLTDRVPYERDRHEVDRVAALAASLGIDVPEGRVPFELTVPEGEDTALDVALGERGVSSSSAVVVVAPGSRWATKRWGAERFAAAADSLAGELGASVVLAGSGEDRGVSSRVASEMTVPCVDLSGELPLGRLLALIDRARVVISNDSAAAHVAAGLKTPVVTVFGPTVTGLGYAPYTDLARVIELPLDCRPCGKHGGNVCPLGTHECMVGVGAEPVVAAALELLGGEADDA